jgi:hypothetical protein
MMVYFDFNNDNYLRHEIQLIPLVIYQCVKRELLAVKTIASILLSSVKTNVMKLVLPRKQSPISPRPTGSGPR